MSEYIDPFLSVLNPCADVHTQCLFGGYGIFRAGLMSALAVPRFRGRLARA